MVGMLGYYGPDPTYRPRKKEEKKPGIVPMPVVQQQEPQPAMFGSQVPNYQGGGGGGLGGSGAGIPPNQTTTTPPAEASFDPLKALNAVSSAKNAASMASKLNSGPGMLQGAANLYNAAAGGHLSSAFATGLGPGVRAAQMGYQFGTPGQVPAMADLAGPEVASLFGNGASGAAGAAAGGGAAAGSSAAAGLLPASGFVGPGAGSLGSMMAGFAAAPFAAMPVAAILGLGISSLMGDSTPPPTMQITPDSVTPGRGVWGYEADALADYTRGLGLNGSLNWHGKDGWSYNGGQQFQTPEEAMGAGTPGGFRDAVKQAALAATRDQGMLQGTAARFDIPELNELSGLAEMWRQSGGP